MDPPLSRQRHTTEETKNHFWLRITRVQTIKTIMGMGSFASSSSVGGRGSCGLVCSCREVWGKTRGLCDAIKLSPRPLVAHLIPQRSQPSRRLPLSIQRERVGKETLPSAAPEQASTVAIWKRDSVTCYSMSHNTGHSIDVRDNQERR